MRQVARAGRRLATLAGLCALAACAPGFDAELERARRLLAADDAAAAVVAAKTAVQLRPEAAEGRLVLGQALLAAGDTSGAVVELERAGTQPPKPADWPATMASAWLAAGQAQKVVSTWDAESPPGVPPPLQLALAHDQLGQADAAREWVAKGLAANRGDLSLQILQLRQRAAGGDLAGAWSQLTALLPTTPPSAELWILHGDLSRARGDDPAQARESYRRALELRPRSVAAHTAAASLELDIGAVAAARLQVNRLLAAWPQNAQARLLDAAVALREGDLRRAGDLTQALMKVAPRHPKVLFLAGLVDATTGAGASAETRLAQAVAADPAALPPRLALADVRLRAGQPRRALDVLGPALGGRSPPVAALLLGAQAQLQLDDPRAADALYKQAAALAPGNPEVRAARARARLASGGDVDAALTELTAAARQSERPSTDLALVAALMKAGKWPEAMKAVDALEQKVKAAGGLTASLRGQIAGRMGDTTGATRHFEAALQHNPAHTQPLRELVRLDLQARAPDRARERVSRFLATHPRSAPALVLQAELFEQQGQPREAIARLQAARDADPTDGATWMALVDLHQRRGDQQAAREAATAAVAALPDHLGLQERLAMSLVAAGQANQAVAALRQVVARRPDAASHLLLARAQEAAGRLDDAQAQTALALRLEPGHVGARVADARLQLRRGKLPEALAAARALRQLQPDDAIGYRLEGEVLLAQAQWKPAIQALRTATTHERPLDTPGLLFRVLLAQGKPGEAAAFAQSWVARHPDDLPFRLFLADHARQSGEPAAAEAGYRQVLERDAANVWALSNLSGLVLAARPQEALALAQRAADRAPFRSDVQAILAAGLAANGRLDAALEAQTQAVSLSPDAPALRLALARLHLADKAREKARLELERVLAMPSPAPIQEEARRLLGTIRG